ncbi:MAG: cysteinyl-tRNA synthetase [Parcubacteria group bacterium Gr01-1014_30]|nr:MAG: cysteinyl-tRNA synthetase [Parcubacteria group bacterium Gr01-1014_30]
MALKLYNTLSRKKEVFRPLKGKKVRLYTCGPTVYWYAHIGNLRTYVFDDLLRRVLEYNGFGVKHVMNITDVGHLTSDEDTGEDKIELGAKREKKTAWQVAQFYTNAFKKDIKRLNIKSPTLWTRATDYIKEQIDLIKVLEKKGFTYKIADGVYFDTSKLKNYGVLAGSQKRKLKPGARVEVVAGKKNPEDFALWKLSPLLVTRQMEWLSPWGKGFPGWHTECVAMAVKHLGLPFDIHTGGIDHISIHHTNEIAQSEAAFGKHLARFWLHGDFLTLQEGKMAKSESNIITLKNLVEKDFNPLALRYLFLTSHYRSKLSFSWRTLKGTQNALAKLYQRIGEIKSLKTSPKTSQVLNVKKVKEKFLQFISDDLDMPKALALLWEVLKDKKLSPKEKKELLFDFDRVFGLKLAKVKKLTVPQEIKKLLDLREKYRAEKNWKLADQLRQKVQKMGYGIRDTQEGPKIKKL